MSFQAADYPLSWSARRRRLWRACPRRYFLHYYAARGGHDPDASRRSRELHLAKSLHTADSYLRTLLNNTMRSLFYRRNEEEDQGETPGLTALSAARFHRDFDRMLLGEWRFDHQKPMLRELLEPGASAEALRRELERELRRRAAALEGNAWGHLVAAEFTRRRPVESPQEIRVNELACYAVPVLALTSSGEFWVVEGTGGDPGAGVALLHKFFAWNRYRRPPERVRSFYFEAGTGDFAEFGRDLNLGMALADLRDDLTEMAAKVRPDGTLAEEDFASNPNHCPLCAFFPCGD